MQDRMASPVDASYHFGAQPLGVAWSPEQLVRLEHEWRQLQRNFAYHPHVRILPIQGNPPAEYTVQFKARTLYIREEDGALEYTDSPSVHIWLPPGYPHEAPVVRPVEALFHPNVTMEGIVLNPAWDANRTLAQLVQQVGALLAYHTYDPYSIWNPAAMDWVQVNSAYLPTDPGANFAPTAGGDPLGRICQRGKASIETLRGQLQDLCNTLVALDEPPSFDEVKHFAEQIRLATNLFLDDDVPDNLRGPATELDQWAETLPGAAPYFAGLRQRHLAVAAAHAATAKAHESRQLLLGQFDAVAKLLPAAPDADPYAALAQLPELSRLQATHATFKVTFVEAEKRLAAARQRLAALTPPDARMSFTHSELLEKTVEAETNRAAVAVTDAQQKTAAAVEALAPIVDRARDEVGSLERVVAWREYADLTAKAQELVDRVVNWGSAGVQAYFVENDGGAFGPFEFEQRLDLGEAALCVRNTGRTSIEVYDVNSGSKLAVSDTGDATVNLPGGEPGEVYPTTFRMTARCDDLWVQVDYLTRQIGEGLSRLRKGTPGAKAETWVGVFDRALSSPESSKRFLDDAKAGILERNSLVTDLKTLSKFKERMATQHLVERYSEMIPRFKKNQADAKKEVKEANERIAYIFSKSQREVETGQPMIPPKYAKDYDAQKKRRDDNTRRLAQLDRRFATAAKQLMPRLRTPALFGSDAVPAPVVLPALPEELAGRAGLMHEGVLYGQVQALEEQLAAKLWPETAAPPEPAAAEVAAAPEDAAAAGAGEYAEGGGEHAEGQQFAEGEQAYAEGHEYVAGHEYVEGQAAAAGDDAFAVQHEEHVEGEVAEEHVEGDWGDLGAGGQTKG